MSLTKALLDHCEKYLRKIDNDPTGDGLDDSIHAVRGYLRRNIDGWTKAGKECLAYGILRNLEDTWELIAEREKGCDCATCQFNSIALTLREICRDRLLLDQLPKQCAAQEDEDSDLEYDEEDEDDFYGEENYIDEEFDDENEDQDEEFDPDDFLED